MPKKILVVDDKANIVLSLEFLMNKAGYDVRTASDGEGHSPLSTPIRLI